MAADIHSLALNLDDVPDVGKGVLASRPASKAAGNRFYVTGDPDNTQNGIEWLDTGSGFVAVAYPDAERTKNKNVANGYAGLGSDGLVPLSLLQAAVLSLTGVNAPTSTTAVIGQLIAASPGVTITLPAPVKDEIVGIFAQSTVTGANPVTVQYGTGAGHIYAMGASAASSYKLGAGQATTILQSDGTNWQVISGQQDTGWVSLSLASGIGANYGSTPAVRLQGDRVCLKGILVNNGGGNSGTLATLPSGFAPPRIVESPGGYSGGTTAEVNASGQINLAGSTFGTGDTLSLDGWNWSQSA